MPSWMPQLEDIVLETSTPKQRLKVAEHSLLSAAATRRFGLWPGTPCGPCFHVFPLFTVRFLQCKNCAFFFFVSSESK